MNSLFYIIFIFNLLSVDDIKVHVATNKIEYKYGEDIIVNLSLKNDSSQDRQVLFDKPAPYGPWYTTVNLINKETGKSALKYSTRALLHSQLYSQEELKKYMTTLKPGETISKGYELSHIAVLAAKNNVLAKGEYSLEVLWEGNYSNTITFTVK